MNLYTISKQMEEILAKAEQGDLTPEDMRLFDEMTETMATKMAGLVKAIKSYEAHEKAASIEIERLQNLQTNFIKQKERLLAFLDFIMMRQGIVEYTTDIGIIKYHSNPPSVNILDLSLIPSQYTESKTTTSISKTLIKKAIESGETVPGAELITDKKTLKIK